MRSPSARQRSSVPRSMRVMPKRSRHAGGCGLGPGEAVGRYARARAAPCRSRRRRPASVQPMVPLRSATTLFGTPALISDCAPMMLRVRPAQLTTTRVSRRGREVVHAQHQLRARHVDRGRDRDALVFVERPAVEHHHVGAGANQAVELVGGDARRGAGVLDEFAERLARHVDAGEQLEARRGPGGNAAVEHGDVGVAGARKNAGGAFGQPIGVVAQHDAGGRAAAPAGRTAAPAGSSGTERAKSRWFCENISSSRTSMSASSRHRPASL